METHKDRGWKEQGNVDRRAAVDALVGDSLQRTVAGPPAAPKLARKTFLVDHTESNASTQSSGGSTWTVKIHDFGKQ